MQKNENRSGYKKTKVGWIPEEWKVEKLDTFVRIISGGTPSRSNLAYWTGTIPWISSSDLCEDDIFKIRIHKYITEQAIEESATKLIPPNSILIVSRVGVGKVAITNDTICTSQDFQSLIFSTDTLEAQYLAYQIKIHTAELLKLNQGTSINGFLKRDLAGLPIPLPPLPEQKAIAAVLECWDRATHKYEEKIEKKKNIKRGLMQRLLSGQRRLPGFEGKWVDIALRDVADPREHWSFTGGPFGSNLKASSYTDIGVRIIQLQNIGDGEFLDDYRIFTSVEKADELISCNIFPGDLILSKMGNPVARACVIPDTDKRYLMCSDGIRLSVDRNNFEPFFVLSVINARVFRSKAMKAGTGSTRRRIGLTQLRKLTIEFPPLPEQKAIASVLSSADSEIKALEKKLAVVKEQKKFLLNNLVTGTIRLPEFCESVVG